MEDGPRRDKSPESNYEISSVKARISRVFSDLNQPGNALRELMQVARELCHADTSYILAKDPTWDRVRVVEIEGLELSKKREYLDRHLAPLWQDLPLAHGCTTPREGDAFEIDGATLHQAFGPFHRYILQCFSCPSGQVAAFFVTSDTATVPLTTTENEALTELSAAIGMIFDLFINQSQWTIDKKRAEVTDKLARIVGDITVSTDELTQLVCEAAAELVSGSEGIFRMLSKDKSHLVLRGHSNTSSSSLGEENELDVGLPGFVLKSGLAVLVGHLGAMISIPEDAADSVVASATYGSSVAVPLVGSEGEILGTLGVLHRKPFRFGKQEQQELSRLAALVVAGLQHRAALALALSEANKNKMLAAAMEQVNVGLAVIDTNGIFQFVNTTFADLHDLSVTELIGRHHSTMHSEQIEDEAKDHINDAVKFGGTANEDIHRAKHDGSNVVCWSVTTPFFDESGERNGSIITVRDMTERVDKEERLLHEASHDPLTGLLNRKGILSHLAYELAHTQEDRLTGLLYIDLDSFKTINDTLGHASGDQLLQVLSSRLRTSLRPGDHVGRLGGDEFVVILTSLQNKYQAKEIADRIARRINLDPITMDNEVIQVTASIGVGLARKGETNAESLLHHSDRAMYKAKVGPDPVYFARSSKPALDK